MNAHAPEEQSRNRSRISRSRRPASQVTLAKFVQLICAVFVRVKDCGPPIPSLFAPAVHVDHTCTQCSLPARIRFRPFPRRPCCFAAGAAASAGAAGAALIAHDVAAIRRR